MLTYYSKNCNKTLHHYYTDFTFLLHNKVILEVRKAILTNAFLYFPFLKCPDPLQDITQKKQPQFVPAAVVFLYFYSFLSDNMVI